MLTMNTESDPQSPAPSTIDDESFRQRSHLPRDSAMNWDVHGATSNLIEAIKFLSSSQALQDMQAFVDHAQSLRTLVREKEEEVKIVRRDSVEQETSHVKCIRDVLATYQKSQNEAESKEKEYKSQLETLYAQQRESEIKLKASEVDKTGLREQIEQLRHLVQEQEDTLVSNNRLIESLNSEVTGKATQARSLLDELHAFQEEYKKVQLSRENLIAEKASLGARADALGSDLKRFKSYSTSLNTINLDECTAQLEASWQSLKELIRSTLTEDVPDSIFNDPASWESFRIAIEASPEIPVFQSNSPDAKKIRIAAVLGLAARSIDKHLLTPCYLFDEDDELRQHLAMQAMGNNERETLLRGMLLAISDDREIQPSARIDQTTREIAWPVTYIATSGQEDTFRFQLRAILSRVTRIWSRMQRSEKKFEASVNLDVLMEHDASRLCSLDLLSGVPETSTEGSHVHDGVMALFPSIFELTQDGFTCVYPGYTLHRSSISAAALEAKAQKHMSQNSSSRPIPTRPRRSSTAGGFQRSPGWSSFMSNFTRGNRKRRVREYGR